MLLPGDVEAVGALPQADVCLVCFPPGSIPFMDSVGYREDEDGDKRGLEKEGKVGEKGVLEANESQAG
jgi:hypothetical protein